MTIRADGQSCVELISAMNTTAHGNALANLAGVDGGDALRKRLSDADCEAQACCLQLVIAHNGRWRAPATRKELVGQMHHRDRENC